MTNKIKKFNKATEENAQQFLTFHKEETTLQLLFSDVKFTLVAQYEAILSKEYLAGTNA
jgi:hypothetical protein